MRVGRARFRCLSRPLARGERYLAAGSSPILCEQSATGENPGIRLRSVRGVSGGRGGSVPDFIATDLRYPTNQEPALGGSQKLTARLECRRVDVAQPERLESGSLIELQIFLPESGERFGVRILKKGFLMFDVQHGRIHQKTPQVAIGLGCESAGRCYRRDQLRQATFSEKRLRIEGDWIVQFTSGARSRTDRGRGSRSDRVRGSPRE